MAVQLAVIALSPWELLVRLTLPLTIAGVPIALWPHRRHVGLWVMFVGLVANLSVVLSNGGLMPIERSTVASAAGEARARFGNRMSASERQREHDPFAPPWRSTTLFERGSIATFGA